MFKTLLVMTISIASVTSTYAQGVDVGPTVVAPTGKVLVNQGQGFVQAADGLTLKFNDKIMVGKDAAVTLAYNKCSVVLKQGTFLTLPKGDLCGKTTVAALQNSEAVKVEPVNIDSFPSLDQPDSLGCPQCLIGVGIVALTVGTIVILAA